MARFYEPTLEQLLSWREWVSERPQAIRAVAERFEPWSLYRLKTTGQRVTMRSFLENGTVTIDITGEFNRVIFDSIVMGIDPADLEPCDLPGPNDLIGTCLTEPDDVQACVDHLRPFILSQISKSLH